MAELQQAYHLSYRQRKRALSTEAQAREISGKAPQKQTVWQALYLCMTMLGILLIIGVWDLSNDGHCTQRVQC